MTRSVLRSRCAEILRALAVAASLLPGATFAAELQVSGRALDGAGKPAAKAAVELFAEGRSEPLARTATAADGRFEIVAPEPGMYRVVLRAAGALPMEAKLLPLLAPTELPPLRLIADEPLRVRLFGRDGPLANVRVAARSLQGRATTGWQPAARAAKSDEKGTLFLPRAKGEPLELTTLGSDFVDVRPARERTIDIRRDGACTRTLLVRGADGRPVSGATVSVEPLRVGSTNDEGLLAIGIPCHGELRASVEASDGRGADVRLRAAADAAPLEVTLEAPERHGGRVIDGETRDPLAGAFVWFDDDPAGFARTDAKGTYALARRGRPPLLRAAAVGHLPSTSGPVFALQPTATLAGSVVDDEGRAVAGADVRIDQDAPEVPIRFGVRPEGLAAHTASRANGAFRIDVLPRRAYMLHVARTGYAPASLVVEKLAPAATKSGLRIVLSRGRSANGRVVEKKTSAPVAGAELRLMSSSRAAVPRWARGGDDAAEEAAFTAVSSSDGSYRFEHLPPGKFDLSVTASGYAPQRVPGLEVSAAQAATFGLVSLERGAIVEGEVVDRGGQPLAGATVFVHPPGAAGARGDAVLRFASEAEETRQGVSGADGSFTVRGLTPGATAEVTVRREGFVTQTVTHVELPPAAPLRIVLEPSARVSGRVVDDRGEPIAGATVTVRAPDAALPVGLEGRLVETDVAGTFVLLDLAAGPIAISAMARNHLSSEPLLLDLGARADVQDVELTLRRGATIEGVVLTSSGQPATAARVTLNSGITPERMLEREIAGSARTDGEGRYRLEGIPAGPQALSASQEGYRTAIRDLVVQPGANQLDFRLAEGLRVGGRVIDRGGAPIAGAAVSLMMTSGSGAMHNEMSAPDGTFRFTGVAPGRFIVSAQREGFATAREEIQLADRAIEDVELQLGQGGGAITGQIMGLTPGDLPSLQITAMKRPYAGMDGLRDGRADDHFTYRVEGVFPGDWSVTARLPDGRQVQRNVTIAEGAGDVQADLEFARGVTLSGHVRRDSQPVADARLQATGVAGTSSGSATTDASGAFRIEGLRPDTHKVTVTVPRSGQRHERMVALTSDQDIDIELPTARVSGHAFDAATGAPLAGVVVTAQAEGSTGGFPPRATTDAAGAFTLQGLGRGQFRLAGSKDGYVRAEVAISVPADDSALDDVRLALSR
jgi:protocatechuate 3,4-dioxygenase beta subunit